MTALTIYGVLGDDLWIDRDGYKFGLSAPEIAVMRHDITYSPDVITYRGHEWDESQVDTLINGFADAPELDPCTRCRTLPILHGGDHCIECAGLVQEQSDTTMRTWRAS
jgi:hypothetical protein